MAKKKSTGGGIADKMAAKVSDGLMDLFESAADERRKYYDANPDDIPDKTAIKSIIASYAYKNAGIAAACNVVPGPWGMLAAVPELLLITRNQLRMICDIAAALGKRTQMDAHLLLAVFVATFGGGALNLAVVKGSKVLVKRASLQVIQKIVKWLGGKITQRVLKQLLAKWLPVVGAAAMAYWAKHSTDGIGNTAVTILSKTIERDDEPPSSEGQPVA